MRLGSVHKHLSIFFERMKGVNVVIISKSEELPAMQCRNFFHSTEMFNIIEHTPGQKPYMAVAYNDDDNILGHLLVSLRRRGSWLPPYIFTQGRAYGEGEYAEDCDKENVFRAMLRSLTDRLGLSSCLYIEFSDLSTKMFGYHNFRRCGYFPVHWMEIHNSLHSMSPEERLTEKAKRHITKAIKAGFYVQKAKTEKSLREFIGILRKGVSFKIRRYIPNPRLFQELVHNGRCTIFTTHSKEQGMVGGCACVYSNSNCYLWYLSSKKMLGRKKVNVITTWTAIKDAHKRGCRHIYFMDVGLPFKKDPYRDFILSFGGKPVGTYRWFRCTVGWINKLLSWIYRE